MAIFPAASSRQFEPDDGITIFDHGVSDEQLSVVRAELHGFHVGLPNRRSTTTYVVTDGRAQITVDGQAFDVEPGDMVVTQVGVRRELSGTASLLIINAPAFDPADEAEPSTTP